MKFKPAWTDALYLLALSLVFWLLATHWELSEHIAAYSGFYESLQLDELPFLLVVLFFGMAWYSWRRSLEAKLELTERTRSEHKVQELLRHNSDLAQRLFTAQEDERRALALELHDEMAQTVTAIRTEAVLMSAQQSSAQDVKASSQRIADAAQQLSQITRHMLHQLRPVALDSMGLREALLALCERWQDSCGIQCESSIDQLPGHMPDYVNVTLYRLVQEALTNAARHSQASRVQVNLQLLNAQTLGLIIADNGIGIDPAQGESQGFGILGMRERVASLKGSLSLLSETGRGVRIQIELPLQLE